ncbi:transposase [Streptomyces sp. NPDC017890]|uniref:transposase n=1 Tax=Streptomyces sp. NPDC017890 TaxID=3365015 RepID=UPI0037B4D60F
MTDDDLCALIEPLLPPRPERAPEPRPVNDRLHLQDILNVLHNDIAWQLLPLELGFSSGQTCWHRMEHWQYADAFDQLHRISLTELNAADELDRFRACMDGSHIRAKKGVPTPVRRRSTGARRTTNTTRSATGAAPRSRPSPPRPTPTTSLRPSRWSTVPRPSPAVHADAPMPCPTTSYDSNPNRDALRKRRTLPVISHKGAPNIKGLGKPRCIV